MVNWARPVTSLRLSLAFGTGLADDPLPAPPPLLPSGSHRGPASSLGCLQARGNPSTSFPREKHLDRYMNAFGPAPDQSRIKLSTSCFLSWCWFPTPTQTRPGPAFQVAGDLPVRNIPGPSYQFYLTITACGREERKGEGRNEREEDSKEGSGGWERKQRGKWECVLKTLPAQQPRIQPALVLRRLSLGGVRLSEAVGSCNRATFPGVGLWLVSWLTEYVQNVQALFL